jgi:SP family general alpha glucoside:H+ symporter-like MFS transporter
MTRVWRAVELPTNEFKCFIMGQLIAELTERRMGLLHTICNSVGLASRLISYLIVCSVAPESPWHLVWNGKLEEAETSLRRLVRKSANIDPKKTLAYIIHTNDLEREIQERTSCFDCFKGIELCRTEIVCMAFAGQIFAGSFSPTIQRTSSSQCVKEYSDYLSTTHTLLMSSWVEYE